MYVLNLNGLTLLGTTTTTRVYVQITCCWYSIAFTHWLCFSKGIEEGLIGKCCIGSTVELSRVIVIFHGQGKGMIIAQGSIRKIPLREQSCLLLVEEPEFEQVLKV